MAGCLLANAAPGRGGRSLNLTRHHLIISGTGRAGTTFLVQLLTELGLDTGFADITSGLYANAHAGMERDIRRPNAPYVIKSPLLCDHLAEALQDDVVIDHALVPVRDLYSAAQSRRDVTERSDPASYPNGVPGGLWHTDQSEQQEAVLAWQLYKLIYTLCAHDIPVTLLLFPRLVTEADYLYRKLSPVLGAIEFGLFHQTFERVVRPELVHTFAPPPG